MLHEPFARVLTPHAVWRVSYPTWKWSVSSLSKAGKVWNVLIPRAIVRSVNTILLKSFFVLHKGYFKLRTVCNISGGTWSYFAPHLLLSDSPTPFFTSTSHSHFSSPFNLASDVHHVLKWTQEDNHLYMSPGFRKWLQSGLYGFAVPLAPH